MKSEFKSWAIVILMTVILVGAYFLVSKERSPEQPRYVPHYTSQQDMNNTWNEMRNRREQREAEAERNAASAERVRQALQPRKW